MIETRLMACLCVVALGLASCQDAPGSSARSATAPDDGCPGVPPTPSETVTSDEGGSSETRILIHPKARRGRITPAVYGINHRYPYAGFDSWDTEAGEPNPRLVESAKYAGFTAMRFPGGRMANPYRWKRAIGPLEERGKSPNGGGSGQAFSNELGPDEFGRLIEATGAVGTIVANFATGSAKEAAEWVEYMNTPVGENPNGGVAWADVRAENGHPEPYDIPYWEIGNEMNSGKVYWMGYDQTEEQKATKYIFGGTTEFEKHRVGTLDSHTPQAAKSEGTPNFVRWVRYPPLRPGSDTLYVDDQAWERVDDLSAAGAADVYELDYKTGEIIFGDGTNGNIPPKGSIITLDYISGPHDGFIDFYREMKEVDPSIEIGAAIHTEHFTNGMGSTYPYDFMVVHSYGYFKGAPEKPGDLHDYLMMLPDKQAAYIQENMDLVSSAGGDAEIAITEYAAGSGLTLGINSIKAPKHYLQSLDGALYTALLIRHWVLLGIPLAEKHSLVDSDPENPPPGYTRSRTADAAVIGPTPCFIPSASAHVFRLFTKMLGPIRVPTSIIGNLQRATAGGSALSALVTLATIDDNGELALLVINRDRAADVRAEVAAKGKKGLGAATLWTLDGPGFLAYNTEAHPNKVSLEETVIEDVGESFTHTFPAHSVTAIRFGS